MAESRFHSLLKVKLLDLRERKMTDLVSGSAKDFSEYAAEVAYLRAITDVINLCEETEREFG